MTSIKMTETFPRGFSWHLEGFYVTPFIHLATMWHLLLRYQKVWTIPFLYLKIWNLKTMINGYTFPEAVLWIFWGAEFAVFLPCFVVPMYPFRIRSDLCHFKDYTHTHKHTLAHKKANIQPEWYFGRCHCITSLSAVNQMDSFASESWQTLKTHTETHTFVGFEAVSIIFYPGSQQISHHKLAWNCLLNGVPW